LLGVKSNLERASSPRLSSKPNSDSSLHRAAAALVQLSSTDMTAMDVPLVTALKFE